MVILWGHLACADLVFEHGELPISPVSLPAPRYLQTEGPVRTALGCLCPAACVPTSLKDGLLG